ncbi:hypothetical protein [Albibacillus kandeliae]|uniref:hypothetical protein n=1 Tax=Albibacillus kandeliae TaxID=2174228 RepID=UPI000D686D05|nr:hypothetical protein [Albibacillus kandeliae]
MIGRIGELGPMFRGRAGRGANTALQVLRGIRMSKDARIERIWEETTETHRRIISRHVLG